MHLDTLVAIVEKEDSLEPNGKSTVAVPAKVFPGAFDSEYQVTVIVDQREINLNVGEDFVIVEGEPSESGTDGMLRVHIVGQEGDAFLVALPGEVDGLPSRIRLPKEMLTRAAA